MTLKHLYLAALAIGLGACATPPEEPSGPDRELVYPPPPEQPRFYFERSIFGSADIEIVDRETRWRRVLTGEAVTSNAFSKPFDVEVCQGRIFVSDSVGRYVHLLDVPTGTYTKIGTSGPGELIKPLGLATDAECNVYIADQTAKRIVILGADGRFVNSLGGPGLFDRLSHVAVNPEGSLVYAVDTGGVSSDRHHVRVFDTATGELVQDIGYRGTGDGEFNLPRDIALGPDGRIYVVDSGNFRVQVFDADGRFIRKFGAPGARSGQFTRPKGIDADPDGNVYISDAAFGNFQIFNPDGQLLLFIGSRAEEGGPGKFMLPAGIAVDEDGRVYMVDQFFRKIDVFRPASIETDEGYLGSRMTGR